MLDLFPPTEQQLRVIEHRGANLLVLAGPGTGKTETLARRFAALVRDGVRAERILVLTFSRRAADEMRDRILLRLRQLSGARLAVSELFVRTFHSFCGRLLDGDQTRVRERRLLTPVKERLLWRRLMRDPGLRLHSFDPSVVESAQFATDCLNVIAQLKGRGIEAERAAALAGGDGRLQDIALLYGRMTEQQGALDLHDYRDLVNEAERALRDADSPASAWLRRAAFSHILVDEFQDSDRMQLKLLEAMRDALPTQPCLCFVGDKNQSIYRFRGAALDNVDEAQTRFACERQELSLNRRSAQAILDIANADESLDATSKTSAADPTKPGSVRFLRPRTVEDEVRCVRDAVAAAVRSGTEPQAIAVLLRETRPYQELIIEALREVGIPVAAQPTAGFHADGLMDAALSALRLLADPSDTVVWQRLLVNPIVGYRPIGVRYAFDVGRRDGVADPQGMLAREEPRGLRPIREFLAAWTRCEDGFGRLGPAELLATIVSELDLLRPVRERLPVVEGFDPGASPARLAALLAAAADYEELASASDARDACLQFVEDLDETLGLLADANQPPPVGVRGVRVISIHAAKGLEFDLVAIPQLIDTVLPADMRPNRLLPARSVAQLRRGGADIFVDDDAARTEEHSLWYVALTRARSDVLVTAARVDEDGVDLQASIFTRPLGEPLLDADAATITTATPGHAAVQQELLAPPQANGSAPAIVVPIETLSPTHINTFLTCPRRFFYGDVLHLPRRGEETTRYGQRLHELLGRFHAIETDFDTIDPAALVERCRRTLATLLLDAPGDEGPLARFEREELQRKLDEYVRSLAVEAGAHPFQVMDCEVSVSSSIGGLAIAGRVDRIDRLRSGELVISDYKASRLKTTLAGAVHSAFEQIDRGELLFGDAPNGLNLQTLLYIPGVEERYDARVCAVQYIYFLGKSVDNSNISYERTAIVDEARTLTKNVLTRDEVERARTDIAARIAVACRDGSMRNFPTTIDEQRCTTCDFVRICPGAGAVPA